MRLRRARGGGGGGGGGRYVILACRFACASRSPNRSRSSVSRIIGRCIVGRSSGYRRAVRYRADVDSPYRQIRSAAIALMMRSIDRSCDDHARARASSEFNVLQRTSRNTSRFVSNLDSIKSDLPFRWSDRQRRSSARIIRFPRGTMRDLRDISESDRRVDRRDLVSVSLGNARVSVSLTLGPRRSADPIG